MLGRRISVLAIVAGLLLPAVVGCLAPSAAEAQTMQCCAQLTCAHGHEMPTCFSATAPTGSSQSTPERGASLVTPSFAAGMPLAPGAPDAAALGSASVVQAPQHSPPKLYTLHLALLI
jgi:hypothetical protein